MAPKKIVPKGTDDIIELTDIVEEGKLPLEDTGKGLTDASFEDELDSMLADVPELSAAKKEVEAMAGPVAAAAPAAAPADVDDLADLDSLLEGLDDDVNFKPPAPKAPPKAAAPADDVLLDVDDLLAEAGVADKADIAPAAPSVGDDASVDDFLAEFADADSAAGTEGAAAPSASAIDGATVDADELLAELQSAAEPEVEDDDLLAELKSVMGGGEAEEPATPATAPKAEAPAADPFEAAMAAAAPAAPVSADPFEAALAEAAPQAPEAAPAAEVPAADDALDTEDLQQLDALLDDILQPGAAADSIPAAEEAALAEADPVVMPEETVQTASAAAVDTATLAAELLAEDGPLLTTVRDMVRQELEERMAVLEERLTQNLDKAAAAAAAQIIREEIAALAQDLME